MLFLCHYVGCFLRGNHHRDWAWWPSWSVPPSSCKRLFEASLFGGALDQRWWWLAVDVEMKRESSSSFSFFFFFWMRWRPHDGGNLRWSTKLTWRRSAPAKRCPWWGREVRGTGILQDSEMDWFKLLVFGSKWQIILTVSFVTVNYMLLFLRCSVLNWVCGWKETLLSPISDYPAMSVVDLVQKHLMFKYWTCHVFPPSGQYRNGKFFSCERCLPTESQSDS